MTTKKKTTKKKESKKVKSDHQAKEVCKCSKWPWNKHHIHRVLFDHQVRDSFYPEIEQPDGSTKRELKISDYHAWRKEHNIHHPKCGKYKV